MRDRRNAVADSQSCDRQCERPAAHSIVSSLYGEKLAKEFWDRGADADFHRRDLWDAIAGGDFPEYELGLQIFDEKTANRFEFDVLDATKLIPEEFVPLQMVGKMVLNRNPDNFFAETEQVAFCPSHLVPGLDFSEDPLLQGRLFSYLDTQLSRLGGPNFHQLPINAPKCPFHNLQRDGIHQTGVPTGRVAYEPNSLNPDAPRESMDRGFVTSQRPAGGSPVRVRSATFSDHYSQARLFYRSITPPEQKHLANALTFELSKVETEAVRLRMLGHLVLIDRQLADTVIGALGAEGKADKITPARTPINLSPSPALRLYGKFKPTLEGRRVGVLLGTGFDAASKNSLVAKIEREGAKAAILAEKIHGEVDSQGRVTVPDMALRTAPSVLFDAVIVLSGPEGDKKFAADPNAVSFLVDAKRHCKPVGFSGIPSLAKKTLVAEEAGIVDVSGSAGAMRFITAGRHGRFWEREAD